MQPDDYFEPSDDPKEIGGTVETLRNGRSEILRDWVDRVRDNRAVKAGETLSDPLLLDHIPQLFDALEAGGAQVGLVAGQRLRRRGRWKNFLS